MEIEMELSALGYELPTPSQPTGNYIPHVQVGEILFVGGTIGRFEGVPLKYPGKVGGTVTLEQAYEMARDCALNHRLDSRMRLETWIGSSAS